VETRLRSEAYCGTTPARADAACRPLMVLAAVCGPVSYALARPAVDGGAASSTQH